MIFNLNERFKNINKIYSVSDVTNGFNYWYWKLFNVLLDMFNYKGLPSSLPKREIETQLLLTGHCTIFQDGNELVTCSTNLFGFDRYYNPTKATYANPVMKSKTLTIGDDCIVVYNNSLHNNVSYIPSDGSCDTLVCRYARQLADIESTINIYMVNNRATSYPVASNDSVKQSLTRFFSKLKNGDNAVISDDAIIQQFRNVDIIGRNQKDGINDLLIARDKILEMYFREVGLKMYQPKKAQVNNEELEANNQILLLNHDDMENERRMGFDAVNDLFGTSIEPVLNSVFNLENDGVKGGENDDSI